MGYNSEMNILKIFLLLWGKRRNILISAFIGSVLGVIIALSIPRKYESIVILAPESKRGNSLSLSSLGGIASMMGVNMPTMSSDGIDKNVYPEIIKSTPFLDEFMDIRINYNSEVMTLCDYITQKQRYPWWNFFEWFNQHPKSDSQGFNNPSPRQRVFEKKLLKTITVLNDRKTGLYTIKCSMQDPVIAAIVSDSLVTKLERYMINYYTAKTRADLKSAEEILDRARKEYYTSDSTYAIVFDQNQHLITQSGKIKRDRLKNERDLYYQIYNQATTQVEYYKMKIQEETPIATIIEPARVPNKPAQPSRSLLVIMFCLLGGVLSSGYFVIKNLS